MRKNGAISFYAEDGQLIYTRRYCGVKARLALIEAARMTYGLKAFQRMSYGIVPDISESEIKDLSFAHFGEHLRA